MKLLLSIAVLANLDRNMCTWNFHRRRNNRHVSKRVKPLSPEIRRCSARETMSVALPIPYSRSEKTICSRDGFIRYRPPSDSRYSRVHPHRRSSRYRARSSFRGHVSEPGPRLSIRPRRPRRGSARDSKRCPHRGRCGRSNWSGGTGRSGIPRFSPEQLRRWRLDGHLGRTSDHPWRSLR